ncbi:MAG: ABC transporter substrate-binding protein [Bacilli bacterium]|nr:ABC transporter substrate-binding protein [Bacilli bacterium]MDD4065446.1 ABC transporter substrate-binding protein [Bacilli bacterium]
MQKKNIIRFASIAAIAISIAGCNGSKKEPEKELVDTYNYIFTAEPSTFDYLADYHSATFDIMVQFIDGLIEFDTYGILQGAIAESWEKNSDSSVWTFKLKKGLNWVTNDGTVYGEITADDFVASMQHCLDAQGGAEYILADVKNANAYMAGSVSFDEVGVKALDKYTIQYTLSGPVPYFETMVEYGPFFPMNREFFESQGCSLGLDKWDANVCKFGVLGDATSILYNGAYLLSEYTTGSKISMVANSAYWDADTVVTKKINLIYDDGSNLDARLTSFINGDYSALGISQSIEERAKSEIGDSIYITETTACTYYGAFNLNRLLYDSGTLHSAKTDAQKADTKKAILNANFRKAFIAAWDTSAQNALSVGDTLKDAALRNTLAAPGLVALPEAYDGVAAGTDYVDVVAHYLSKLDSSFDGSMSDGHSAFHDVTKAKAYAAKAKSELSAAGVSFPIVVDIMYYGASQTQANNAASFKSSVEAALGTDFIRIDTHSAATTTEYYYNGYYASSGDEVFYDFFYGSGWCPDYADPQTYVNIYGLGNDMMTHIAIDVDQPEDVAAYNACLGEYNTLLTQAKAESQDIAKRYALFAQAEASLLSSATVTPYLTQGGNYAATRVIPHTVNYTKTGTDNSKYKFFKVAKDILTADEVAKYRADWATERENKYNSK